MFLYRNISSPPFPSQHTVVTDSLSLSLSIYLSISISISISTRLLFSGTWRCSTVRVGDAPNYDWAGSVGSYSSGGFSIDLSGPLALDKWTDPQDYTDDLKFRLESTDTVLECLSHRNGWVDEQTRAVMIGFLVFNPTFNFWLQVCAATLNCCLGAPSSRVHFPHLPSPTPRLFLGAMNLTSFRPRHMPILHPSFHPRSPTTCSNSRAWA